VIAHIVLFRPRAKLGPAERASLIEAYETALREIPSIRQARVGTRVTHGRSYEQLMTIDYEYAVVLEFDNVAGLKAYLEHPAHERLGSAFKNAFEHALMYDYEWMEEEPLPPPW
jgi:hypothetical protein